MAETITIPDGWRYLRFPLTGGKDCELWLPVPFTARDLYLLGKFVDLMGEAMFGTEEERRMKLEASCASNLPTTEPSADSPALQTPNTGPNAD